MIISRLTAALAALALLLPALAQAWGFYAHGVTAQIAMVNSSPDVRRKVQQLMRAQAQLATPECPITSVEQLSTWADCIRRERWRWGYTAAWHYRTAPVCEAYNARANCSGGNCVNAQISRNLRLLADENLPDAIRLEGLAFLVHFVGDIHQPLHSGDDHDRGGNNRTADYGIVPGLRLHSIWDSALAERAVTSGPDAIIRSYTAAERADLGGGMPDDWGRESWQTARDFVYPIAFDRKPCEGDLPEQTQLTQEDIVAAVPVARRRVQQAGIRIAEMLELAFAPGPLEETANND